jgi:hypothetical protein
MYLCRHFSHVVNAFSCLPTLCWREVCGSSTQYAAHDTMSASPVGLRTGFRMRDKDKKLVDEAAKLIQHLLDTMMPVVELGCQYHPLIGMIAAHGLLVCIDKVLAFLDKLIKTRAVYGFFEPRWGRQTPVNPFMMPEDQFVAQFRFTKVAMCKLVRLLRLPVMIKGQGVAVKSRAEIALCMLCAKYSSPKRLHVELPKLFRTSRRRISAIIAATQSLLLATWGDKLAFDVRLVSERTERYTHAIRDYIKRRHPDVPHDFGCFWAFIDGTVRPMCHPCSDDIQRAFYNGHHRVHAMKFQAVVTPDGLIASLMGPYRGNMNDRAMVRDSQIEPLCQMHVPFVPVEGTDRLVRPMMHGDGGYVRSSFLFTSAGCAESTRHCLSSARCALHTNDVGAAVSHFVACLVVVVAVRAEK